MTEYVIRLLGFAVGPLFDVPQFLAAYDPEAHDGQGQATGTLRLAEALRFPSFKAATDCWRSIPDSRPAREDGQPNRPLTAFHVEIIPIGDAT
jgi:hypothetical protein